jgi:hypothetical protein
MWVLIIFYLGHNVAYAGDFHSEDRCKAAYASILETWKAERLFHRPPLGVCALK